MLCSRTLGILLLVGTVTGIARAQDTSAPAATTLPSANPTTHTDDKPLPDITSLIARAKANQAHLEEIRKNYLCTLTSIVDDFDSKGTKKGTHTDVYQVFFVDKFQINQHTMHDGKPLNESEARKEQERVDKEIAEIKAGKRKPNQNNSGYITMLLKVATFSNPRRVDMDGRSTIAFDYTGDPHAKTSDVAEVIASHLAGTVWIDEQDAAIHKLNGTLEENFHVAGGLLVNVKKDSHFEIMTEHVNGEIWFTHTLVAHVDGHILLFKGFDSDPNITFSDYRKMKTSVTISPGNHVIGPDGEPLPEVIDSDPTANPQPGPPTTPKM